MPQACTLKETEGSWVAHCIRVVYSMELCTHASSNNKKGLFIQNQYNHL